MKARSAVSSFFFPLSFLVSFVRSVDQVSRWMGGLVGWLAERPRSAGESTVLMNSTPNRVRTKPNQRAYNQEKARSDSPPPDSLLVLFSQCITRLVCSELRCMLLLLFLSLSFPARHTQTERTKERDRGQARLTPPPQRRFQLRTQRSTQQQIAFFLCLSATRHTLPARGEEGGVAGAGQRSFL